MKQLNKRPRTREQKFLLENSLWTQESHPLNLRFCLSQSLWSPRILVRRLAIAWLSRPFQPFPALPFCRFRISQRLEIPPTTSYSLVTRQAVTMGPLNKAGHSNPFSSRKSGSGSFVVVALSPPADIYTSPGRPGCGQCQRHLQSGPM